MSYGLWAMGAMGFQDNEDSIDGFLIVNPRVLHIFMFFMGGWQIRNSKSEIRNSCAAMVIFTVMRIGRNSDL